MLWASLQFRYEILFIFLLFYFISSATISFCSCRIKECSYSRIQWYKSHHNPIPNFTYSRHTRCCSSNVSFTGCSSNHTYTSKWGWSGGAKVLCILHHWGVQLILAYSWARPAILVVGKGRGGMFLFLLFLHFHSCSSFFPVPLFHLLFSLFYLFSPFLWETTQNDPQGLTCR